ncbi:MAG: response regulator [Acidobacteriota bacterium]
MATILVVDDNRDNRRVISRLLEFGGHAAVTARDGHEALESARSAQPDLVLMDLAMPEMDGWATTAAMKQADDLRAIPVIVVTGHVTRDDILRAQEVGCQDVVSKPVDYYVLMDKVARHLGSASNDDTEATPRLDDTRRSA